MVIIGLILIFIGAIFLFLGALGIYRMPDVYNKLQAGTKATTLGSFSMLLGLGFIHPAWFPKFFIIAVFLLLTNPISAHAVGRSAHKAGIEMCDETCVDQYKEDEK